MSSVILEISKFLYQFFLTYFTSLVQLSLNECVHVCGYFLITKVISNMSVFYAPLYCWWLSHIKYGFCIFQLLLKSPCSLILWNPLCCRPIDAKFKNKKPSSLLVLIMLSATVILVINIYKMLKDFFLKSKNEASSLLSSLYRFSLHN